MFQVNDVIIYGSQGICRILGTEEKNLSGTKKTYYVLKPVDDGGATFFAPADNEKVLQKMRRLLTKEEIGQLIDSMPAENPVWIPNEGQRKELYRKILSRGDHAELIRMIKAIYAHKKDRETDGKRLHMSDENFLKDAERMLYGEFRYVLDLPDRDALMRYIVQRIEGGVR